MALFAEAIVPLKRGPDGNLGIASSGGGWRSQHSPHYTRNRWKRLWFF